MKLSKINLLDLEPRAQRFFEESDKAALQDLFGECKSIEDINNVAIDMYDLFFGEVY